MPTQPKEDYKTIVIDNLSGRLTRYINGDLNSGMAKYSTTHSIDNFAQPGNLTFMEQATQIDAAGTILSDLIMAGKERLETNGNSYVYAIGHTGRFYKIQVNNTAAKTAQYDNPVLLTTLTNSQTFQFGSSIEFFEVSGTIFVWIASDAGITKINFDGTGETYMTNDVVSGVPHQILQFVGSLFFTNGINLGQIDSSGSITTGTKLTPGFPGNTQARDIRQTSDGRYAVIVVSEIPLDNILDTGNNVNSLSSGKSYLVYWNGSDEAASSDTVVPSFNQTAYISFESYEYVFGYDITGGIVSTPQQKILTNIFNNAPLPNAVTANGNIVGWLVAGFDQGFLKAKLYLYGSLDAEVAVGYYLQYKQAATSPATDVLQIPFCSFVSNFDFGASTSGFPGNVIGFGRMYFSTFEYDGATPYYRFYTFNNVPTGAGIACQGVYETQTQLFGEKRQIKEVRVYTEPFVANNSFQIDLIGSNNDVISGSTKVFTAGSNGVLVGDDVIKYNPPIGPTYCLGVRVTNLGMANWVAHKIEVDHSYGGNYK